MMRGTDVTEADDVTNGMQKVNGNDCSLSLTVGELKVIE